MDLTLRPMTQAEQTYCYSQSQQISNQTGLIGHFRADFGSTGTGFFPNFFDFRKDLKSEDFNPDYVAESDTRLKYLPADEYLSGNVREKLRRYQPWQSTSRKPLLPI